tara:strand:- start:660 stop:2411 length:1752 start_codon:yes stop_codon:yes gene_type:complete
MGKAEFNKFVSDLRIRWESDTDRYENKIAGYSISPQLLQEIWSNKDDETDTPIKNSPGNRPPNWNNTQKRRSKYAYLIGCICDIRDYNMLPVSMIIPEEGKTQYNSLLAKDRGTFNYYLSKVNEPQSISFWKSLVLDLEEYSHNTKMKLVINKVKELIEKDKPFSPRASIPTSMWDEWISDDELIYVRIKFETYDNHSGEMARINENTNQWVLHNHIINKKILPLIHSNPNTYKSITLDKVYKKVCDYPLFSGEHKLCMTNPPKPKVEEYESFTPWLFHSLSSKDTKKDYNTRSLVSAIARGTKKNEKIIEDAYLFGFKDSNFESNFIETLKLLDTIANHTSTSIFATDLEDYIDTNYPNTNERPSNISALPLSKVDTFMTVGFCIRGIQIKTNRGGNERLHSIINNFMISASELLNDTKAMNDLAKINGGLENRYDKFWEKVVDSTIDKLNLIDSEGFSRVELDSILKADLKNKGLTFGGDIYDRKSSTEFVMISIDDGVGLQEGHLIPTEPLAYGNVVLQPKHDNEYNKNHPIKNIDGYVEEYLEQLDEYIDNSMGEVNPIAKIRTETVLNSWKRQKEYKV